MIKFSKTIPDGRHVTEARDCTVRALAHVLDMPYSEAHATMASFGRKPRRGVPRMDVVRAYASKGLTYIRRSDRPTLAQFMREDGAKHDRLVVNQTGHVFAIINGPQLDTAKCGPRTRVQGYYVPAK
jgi:hypothetical protein